MVCTNAQKVCALEVQTLAAPHVCLQDFQTLEIESMHRSMQANIRKTNTYANCKERYTPTCKQSVTRLYVLLDAAHTKTPCMMLR